LADHLRRPFPLAGTVREPFQPSIQEPADMTIADRPQTAALPRSLLWGWLVLTLACIALWWPLIGAWAACIAVALFPLIAVHRHGITR
jgi:uncharacterized membrane protein